MILIRLPTKSDLIWSDFIAGRGHILIKTPMWLSQKNASSPQLSLFWDVSGTK